MKEQIKEYFKDSIKAKEDSIELLSTTGEKVAKWILEAFQMGNKVLVFGNGGSASDAQHFVAEFVGRFKKERRALPAIALTTDTSILTAIGNDYGYDKVFSRQIEALAEKGDIVIGITTSGNSPNVLAAFEKAKELGCTTIGLTGGNGGKIPTSCDLPIVVPADYTPHIQEVHITFLHVLCQIVENEIAGE